jgi:hypothetical protein
MWGYELDLTGWGLGAVSSHCGQYNEPKGFMYGVEFHQWLITVTFQRGTSIPQSWVVLLYVKYDETSAWNKT